MWLNKINDLLTSLKIMRGPKIHFSQGPGGVLVLSGTECYKCFDTRRRNFDLTEQEMIEQKAASREVEDKWTELRCCGFYWKHFCYAKHPFRSDSYPKKVLRRLHQCMQIPLYRLAIWGNDERACNG